MQKVISFVALMLLTTFGTFSQTSEKPLKVAIFIYEGAEMLDFVGPMEVFGNAEGFEVFTVAVSKDIVSPFPQKALKITPNYSIDDCPKPDILVLPGGGGATELVMSNQKLIDWIKEVEKTSTLTMSVCTGAALLSKAGILDNKKATTHWGAVSNLQQQTPKAKILKDTRFVYDGKLLTTAGVSAGIDGALFAVQKLRGEVEAQRVATIMEYDYWKPNRGLVVGAESKVTSGKKVQRMQKEIGKKTIVSKRKSTVSQTVNQVLKEDCKDPICKMPIAKGATIVSVYKGKQVGFCSVVCKEMFDKNPAKFTSH